MVGGARYGAVGGARYGAVGGARDSAIAAREVVGVEADAAREPKVIIEEVELFAEEGRLTGEGVARERYLGGRGGRVGGGRGRGGVKWPFKW